MLTMPMRPPLLSTTLTDGSMVVKICRHHGMSTAILAPHCEEQPSPLIGIIGAAHGQMIALELHMCGGCALLTLALMHDIPSAVSCRSAGWSLGPSGLRPQDHASTRTKMKAHYVV